MKLVIFIFVLGIQLLIVNTASAQLLEVWEGLVTFLVKQNRPSSHVFLKKRDLHISHKQKEHSIVFLN